MPHNACFVAAVLFFVVNISPLTGFGSRLQSHKSYFSSLVLSVKVDGYDTFLSDKIDDGFEHQIFCNRELNGEKLQAVGFDMDFTLAQYNEAFDLLAFNGAKEKLHLNLGYPKEVLDFEYDSSKCRRGLIIDKAKGNILKVDRHKYVRKAYHGLRELTAQERKYSYQTAFSQMPTFTESNFVNIDTLFLSIDALLFQQLVMLRDADPDKVNNKSYEQIYKDIRRSVDLCHRDGVIKSAVASDPAKYILPDPGLLPMLRRLKAAGKKVFLLTNSLWTYTDSVMNFLTQENGVEEWTALFDLVVVGAAKPAFLMSDYMSLFVVNRDGTLQNLEDKDSYRVDAMLESASGPVRGNVLQGGYWQDLHRLLGVTSADRILYVGDHMYADILRSKRTLGWRTCLIIPELEQELRVSQMQQDRRLQISALRELQTDLDEYLDVLRQRQKMGVDIGDQLTSGEVKAQELKELIRLQEREYENGFNPYWGLIMKAGYQDSRFAQQVTDYACLYTSRASNLGRVSPNRPFRPAQDFLPHEVFFDSPRAAGFTDL